MPWRSMERPILWRQGGDQAAALKKRLGAKMKRPGKYESLFVQQIIIHLHMYHRIYRCYGEVYNITWYMCHIDLSRIVKMHSKQSYIQIIQRLYTSTVVINSWKSTPRT